MLGYFLAKLITGSTPSASALLLIFLFVGLGVVGFLDDFIKIFKQRNLGLRSKAKMIGQTVIAVTFGILALSPWLEDDRGQTPASLHISLHPRLRVAWTLPTVLVVVLIWLIVTGTSNAVNLTDGLDGLATGACVMVFGAYTLVNIWQNNQSCAVNPGAHLLRGARPARPRVVAAAITGACFGFLWWNASPAQIFMGDTGSLVPRRRAGRPGDPDPHRAAADHPRRPVRGRDAVGDAPGRLVQGHQAPHRHGQAASSGSRRCTTTSRCSAGSRSPS